MEETIGRLVTVPLTGVWRHEAHQFNPWLMQNIDVLSEAIGFALSPLEHAVRTGDFWPDIVADSSKGRVVIECQLGPTDHSHLGQTLTYLSYLGARTAIWICAQARDEHKRACDWLNENTGSDIAFYLVQVSAVRIGDSPVAPRFEIVAEPSPKAKKGGEQRSELAEVEQLQERFWRELLDLANTKTKLHSNIQRPGHWNWIVAGAGVSGFSFVYFVQRSKRAGVQFLIDRGKGKDRETKEAYHRLESHKAGIDATFGEPLTWDYSETRRCQYVVHWIEGAGLKDVERWLQLQRKMVDAMVRLERAIRPYLDELRAL